MKYRKKPVVIEAFRLGQEAMPTWFSVGIKTIKVSEIHGCVSAIISTLEGDMIANHGDWIIQGIKGEIYPCKDDIFQATYERVEE